LEPESVIGVDRCFEGLQWRIKDHIDPRVSFVCGDACGLPIRDKSVDVIINIESSHCYGNLLRFFQECARVLIGDGMFCYTDSFRTSSIRDVNEILASAPFQLIRKTDITSGVTKALEMNRERFLCLLNTMKTGESRNTIAIREVIEGVYKHAYCGYKGGELVYVHWLLKRDR